jgi:hypothetical protein
MNVFFEITDSAVEEYGYKYLALYDVSNSSVMSKLHRHAMLMSTRVWAEEDDGVRYLKNRIGSIDFAIDKKEFFWIKLKSYTL